MVYMPKTPIMTPATWFMVIMWRGRNRLRNRSMVSVRANHHSKAPARKPRMVMPLRSDEAMPSSDCMPTLNMAKKASR